MADREELINSLAKSMGVGNYMDTKYAASRYDKGTGTLYCDGYIITSTVINESLSYFETMKMRADKENSENSLHMALIYKTAIEAIKMMQDTLEKEN
ncbi:MAG: hypothetical protein IJ608_12035 [Lachnospiraceae bacterium]|nr:hypothetical protein [Lachnospiraceae bacterium]